MNKLSAAPIAMKGSDLAYVVVAAIAKAELTVYNVSAFAKTLFIMQRNADKTVSISAF